MNALETQEVTVEINLEDMAPMQDDELKTVAGGTATYDGQVHTCHYHN